MVSIQRFLLLVLVVVTTMLATHGGHASCDDGREACEESDGVVLMQFRYQVISDREQADDESGAAVAQSNQGKAVTMTASAIVKPNLHMCTVYSVTSTCNIDWSRIQLMQMPVPTLRHGNALVRVVATSVNPCEWKGPLVSNANFGTPISYPFVTGIDFSGVIVDIDKNSAPCGSLSVGDEVWGMFAHTHAEYMEASCNHLAKKPKAVSFLQAGAFGVAAMTSLEGLSKTGVPWPANTTVLIIGGSSGTGHFGIQLAKSFGASKIITTCSPDDNSFVMSLGADEVIDYHSSNWWEVIPAYSVHVVYDCISLPDSGNHAYKVLADGGHYIGLLPDAAPDNWHKMLRPSIKQEIFLCSWSSTPYLEKLNAIVDAGNLTAHLDHVFQGLAQVPQMFNSSMQGHTVGRLALQVSTNTTVPSF